MGNNKENKRKHRCAWAFCGLGFLIGVTLILFSVKAGNFALVIPGAFFLFASLGLVIFSIKMGKKKKIIDALKEKYPGEPWRWNPSWQTAQIKAEVYKVRNNLNGAILLNLVLIPFWWALIDKKADWGGFMVLGLIQAIAIGLGMKIAYEVMKRKKYGTALFDMETYPAYFGGECQGKIYLMASYNDAEKGLLTSCTLF